jgi:hypothetical protein
LPIIAYMSLYVSTFSSLDVNNLYFSLFTPFVSLSLCLSVPPCQSVSSIRKVAEIRKKRKITKIVSSDFQESYKYDPVSYKYVVNPTTSMDAETPRRVLTPCVFTEYSTVPSA